MATASASPAPSPANVSASTAAPPKPGWLKVAPVIFLVFWSNGFVASKFGLAHAEPLTFLTLRYACVVAVLILAFAILRPPLPTTRRAWMHLMVVGLLLQAAYFATSFIALSHGMSAGGTALITSLQPILVGLFAPMIANERVGARQWLGLAMGVGGSALVIAAKSNVDLASPVGLSFAVVSLITLTAGTLWEKRFGSDAHPVSANLIQYGVALLATAPLAWMFETMHIDWAWPLIGSLAYLVICNSLIAMTLLLGMLRHGEASRVSALFFLVPPGTAIFAFLLLGERIPTLAWPGMLLAAAGIMLVTRKGKPAHEK
ncbi:DMT family transporter [Pigmentiphaga aceris]|uniref:DMT family transporter n=1 Tax=Pigmentiphaga aceris TaxID=1940612 RepID=A0A5C0B3G5_9BURK|nr:DMT family transporter [Pigmentiphaga aceris]QEI07760.1 DMT family transporter [Pigmentiphaga aceris]